MPKWVAHLLIVIAWLAICMALIVYHANARPPEDADPALAPWFQGLKSPDSHTGCCSQADCRAVDTRPAKDGSDNVEVYIGPQFDEESDRIMGIPPVVPHWMIVPKNKIMLHHDNPVGRAVVCWHRVYENGKLDQIGKIECYVPPIQV